MSKTKSDESKLRPREREFLQVSSGLIYSILVNLNPDDEKERLAMIPDSVRHLRRDVEAWAEDKITDKTLCGRLSTHWHNLIVLFEMLCQQKEVKELLEDHMAYDKEWAERNPDPDDESPFS